MEMVNTSIIVPAYNEAEHLPNLLDSLNRHVSFPVEVVVVDNGSTDPTLQIARQYGCRVIELAEKSSPSIARNAGVSACGSQVLVFLDADIVVTQTWARELQALCSDKTFTDRLALTGESYHMSLQPSWIERYWFEPLRKGRRSYINGGNIVVTRRAFQKVGGFNPDLDTGEDVDFSARATDCGVDLTFNSRLIVHHEGFPKTISNFFRREKWHGKGDFVSLDYFRKSKVAQVAVVLGLCYVTAFLFLPLTFYGESAMANFMVLASLILVVGLCAAASTAKFRSHGLGCVTVGTFIYFVYFNSRLLSFFGAWRDLNKAPDLKKEPELAGPVHKNG